MKVTISVVVACALGLLGTAFAACAATAPAAASSIGTPASATTSAQAASTDQPSAAPAPAGGETGSKPGDITLGQPEDADAGQDAAISQAMSMLQARQFDAALHGPIADVLAYYDKRYGKDTKTRYFSVRSGQEALLYLATAARKHQDAKALGPAWGDAYFMKGSALNSMGRYADARDALDHAVALSPFNPSYLIELAFSFEKLHETAKALELCDTAQAMSAMSPDDVKLAEQTRALRCEGFNLTDLHRYDDAVKKYEAALKLNPNDDISKRELEYVRKQQTQPTAAPSD